MCHRMKARKVLGYETEYIPVQGTKNWRIAIQLLAEGVETSWDIRQIEAQHIGLRLSFF